MTTEQKPSDTAGTLENKATAKVKTSDIITLTRGESHFLVYYWESEHAYIVHTIGIPCSLLMAEEDINILNDVICLNTDTMSIVDIAPIQGEVTIESFAAHCQNLVG